MAFGHGGARPGAGGPRGGISQLRRTLNAAIVDGLALAGREKGLVGDRELVARQAAAHIVSDMILAGRGEEVLKLGAVVAPKMPDRGGDGGLDDDESPVLAALSRMPGMLRVQEQSRDHEEDAEIPASTRISTPGTSDCTSDGARNWVPHAADRERGRPFFAPQLPLLPGGSEGERSGAAPPPAGAGARAPHPPAGPPHPPIHLDPAPFENFSESAAPGRAAP